MCRANVVSNTCSNPRDSLQNASTLLRTSSRLSVSPDECARDAARDANDCGAMDMTGVLCEGEGDGRFEERKERTSV